MPNHPAAVRAYQQHEAHFDKPEDQFTDPDLPAIITREYRPFELAARLVVNICEQMDCKCAICKLRKVLKEVCGE